MKITHLKMGQVSGWPSRHREREWHRVRSDPSTLNIFQKKFHLNWSWEKKRSLLVQKRLMWGREKKRSLEKVRLLANVSRLTVLREV